jgi:hypothetical protein
MVDKVALGRVSPTNSCSTHCSTLIIIYHPGADTIGQLVASVPSGLSLTPPQELRSATSYFHSVSTKSDLDIFRSNDFSFVCLWFQLNAFIAMPLVLGVYQLGQSFFHTKLDSELIIFKLKIQENK